MTCRSLVHLHQQHFTKFYALARIIQYARGIGLLVRHCTVSHLPVPDTILTHLTGHIKPAYETSARNSPTYKDKRSERIKAQHTQWCTLTLPSGLISLTARCATMTESRCEPAGGLTVTRRAHGAFPLPAVS